MPRHEERRKLPYSADQVFELVADVEAYPDFLPWCSKLRVTDRRPEGSVDLLIADMTISFKIHEESFLSKVTLSRERNRIDVEYLEGPFKFMNSRWEFKDLDYGCLVSFSAEFEFRSRFLRALIGTVFSQAVQRVVRAFEDRARAVYGESPRGCALDS
ncbi:MAG: type II toxin-antitoxin system RatA family toxin [Albidovulum sp.]|nr:type II toxin-antitoxin system RatA family toxin [Albidovulum sp.]MDE0532310.1 type II toxin-antitoxin system RatA family toxin [Albidovulum sp.]